MDQWTSLPLAEQQLSQYKREFIIISLISLIISGLTAFIIGAVFIHLANTLHNTMLKRIAHAPMQFFNSNPLGRIINRFSKDTAMADSVVTFQMIGWLQVSSF